jgi:hypothetical protein
MTTTSAIIDGLSRAFPEATIRMPWRLLSDALMDWVSSGHVISVVMSGRLAIRMQGRTTEAFCRSRSISLRAEAASMLLGSLESPSMSWATG